MYNTNIIAERIKERAKIKGTTIKNVLITCDLGRNTIAHLRTENNKIAAESLAKIADALDCSMDYLVGRTNNPEVNR